MRPRSVWRMLRTRFRLRFVALSSSLLESRFECEEVPEVRSSMVVIWSRMRARVRVRRVVG